MNRPELTCRMRCRIRPFSPCWSGRRRRALPEEEPPPAEPLATLARFILGAPDRPRRRPCPARLIEALIAEIDLVLSAQAQRHAARARIPGAGGVLAGTVDAGPRRRADDTASRSRSSTSASASSRARCASSAAAPGTKARSFAASTRRNTASSEASLTGLLVGDYAFDHRPDDALTLGDIARIAAAAHVPFIAAAAPSLLQMESWTEVANPRDLPRIFLTPEYVAWRSLREQEDARYLGLCMPRFLLRLPYGAATDPLDAFAFEEEYDGGRTSSGCSGATRPSLSPPTWSAPSPPRAGASASAASTGAASLRGCRCFAIRRPTAMSTGARSPKSASASAAIAELGHVRPDTPGAPQEQRRRRLHQRAIAAAASHLR